MTTAKNNNTDHSLLLVIVAMLGWLIPGAGHLVIKEVKRAVIIFVTITLLFVTGVFIGSIGIIDPVTAKLWYMAQLMVSPVVFLLANIAKSGAYEVYGHPQDIGQIYTAVAGLLNLLCILSAVYMAHSGRGELIGDEEEEEND